MIAPIIIVCKERYAKMAQISVNSFLKYHNVPLYVIVDALGKKALAEIVSKNLRIIPIEKYTASVMEEVEIKTFSILKWDKDGDHDRTYSSLKPLIMDKVIADLAPQSKYVLSLDADTIFSGNLLNRVVLELNKVKHKFDLYMVKRRDPQMLLTKAGVPGSGFTLWKRKGGFIHAFQKKYGKKYAGPKGGSQDLTNLLRKRIPSMLFNDPLLHMVSPDLKNRRLTNQEILKMKPAYIHLHGKNSYERLLRFKDVFEKGS